jgi:hypothetical protein
MCVVCISFSCVWCYITLRVQLYTPDRTVIIFPGSSNIDRQLGQA